MCTLQTNSSLFWLFRSIYLWGQDNCRDNYCRAENKCPPFDDALSSYLGNGVGVSYLANDISSLSIRIHLHKMFQLFTGLQPPNREVRKTSLIQSECIGRRTLSCSNLTEPRKTGLQSKRRQNDCLTHFVSSVLGRNDPVLSVGVNGQGVGRRLSDAALLFHSQEFQGLPH